MSAWRSSKTNYVSLQAMPVHQINRFRFVNAYLVEEEDGLTLVDTMLPRSEEPDPGRRRRRSGSRSAGSR